MTFADLKQQLSETKSFQHKTLAVFWYVVLFRWYNRFSWKWLLGSFAAVTLLCGAAYFGLSKLPGKNGIHYTSGDASINLFDGFYFSVATETTVGYGDLAPQGLSRLVSCFQALVGLLLAGMSIDKITSGPGQLLKSPVEKCSGDWIELRYKPQDDLHSPPGDVLVISLVTIAYVDGALRYDGHNYDQFGRSRGFFRGHLTDDSRLDRNMLTFNYSNRHSRIVKDWAEGLTYLTFIDKQRGQYARATGLAVENATGEEKQFDEVYRASAEQQLKMRSTESAVLCGLTREIADAFCRERKWPLWPDSEAS